MYSFPEQAACISFGGNRMDRLESKKYHLLQNMIYVYKGVAKHKPYLILLLFLSAVCTTGARFVSLFLSKSVIELISEGTGKNLVSHVLLLVLLQIVFMLGQSAADYGKEPAALYVRPMFMLERNKLLMGMKYENLEYKEILDAIEKSKGATSWTETGIEGMIRHTIRLFSDLLICLAAMVILCRANPVMILLVLLFGVLSYQSVNQVSKNEKELTEDSIAFEKRKLNYFREVSRDFAYGKDIRLYRSEGPLLETQHELNKCIHQRVVQARNKWMQCHLFTGFLDMAREGMMYLFLIYSILFRGLSIGNFTLYVGCVRNFAQAFQTLMTTYASLKQCSRGTNDYRTLNEFCQKEKGEGEPVPKSDTYEFRFENVSFRYPGSNQDVLKNMNITIDASQKLAIVGLNGAGKTTFIKLLLGLYEPVSGTIYLNGTDIKTFSKEEYYKLFSPVFQDMECYAFSLAENVSMQDENKTDKKKAEQCLKQAGLSEKLAEWKKGVDTPILKILYQDGIEPSGGEKQKMALARALYKDAPVVVLDEPAAALDAIAEGKMYEDFDSLVKSKTSVYISHRLSSTRFCDVIAMFEAGEIIEYGPHEKLMEQKGKYAEMFAMQAHYYKEVSVN